MSKSKCIYCGSEAYGRGCAYSPNKVHLHIDDPKRCIYCGSNAFGLGCPYNPHGKNHIHGIEFNNMTVESVHKSVLASILLVRLFETELNKDNALDFFLQRIQEMVGLENLEFIKDRLYFKANKPLLESNDQIRTGVNIQFEIKENIKTLLNTIKEAYKQDIPRDVIDNMLTGAIVSNIQH
jgi:hypothetical protein